MVNVEIANFNSANSLKPKYTRRRLSPQYNTAPILLTASLGGSERVWGGRASKARAESGAAGAEGVRRGDRVSSSPLGERPGYGAVLPP